MLLKETSFPKTGNDDVLKISSDIKALSWECRMKWKTRTTLINEYAKIINRTKTEYQKLNAENVRYKEILQQKQERFWKEEEFRQYWKQKQLCDSIQHKEQCCWQNLNILIKTIYRATFMKTQTTATTTTATINSP